MLISRQWLESMLAPSADGEALSDLAFGDALTALGLEVEGVESTGRGLEAIIVGRVESLGPHPKADKLRLVTIFDGKNKVPVVCGAPNVPDPGGLVAFAPVGTTMPGGLEIGARAIRGEQSEGMICSEAELEIGSDDDGILVLPSDWTPGDRLIDRVKGVVDTIYEIGVTPNRPDALGHVGVAIDLAVKLRRACTVESPSLPDAPSDDGLVQLQAPDRCGRYIARAFEGAQVGPSPLWLRVRLHRLGLRAINNVVDITNLVLMQWGQPLHAFDRAKLEGGGVVVRMASAGEPMTTLDDAALELTTDDLVIADGAHPQALAGVMGGKNSGVELGANTLLLEAAWFLPPAVRRTARRHGLNTDSSYRFERGVDHGAHLTAAAATAAALLEELAGARCVGASEAHGEVPSVPAITLRAERTEALLGMPIPAAEARRVLQGLRIGLDLSTPDAWVCTPPSYRPDLQIEEDLIEELVRHYGLDRLPTTPAVPSEPPSLRISASQRQRDHRMLFEDGIADALRAAGYGEHLAFAFTDPAALEPFASASPVSSFVGVANPLRIQTSVMRTHMMPGLLSALSTNVARHGRPVRLFEVGRIYDWVEGKTVDEGPTASVDAQLPRERGRAAVLLFDKAVQSGASITGVVLDALARVGQPAQVRAVDSKRPWLHPGVQAQLVISSDQGPTVIGELGEVHPDLLGRWDVPKELRAYYAEVWLDVVEPPSVKHYRAVPRFPATSRDVSLELPIKVAAAAVVEALVEAEASVPLAGDDPVRLSVGDSSSNEVDVVEDYRGQGVPEGSRALLLRLHYRAAGRSVTDAEVQERHGEVVQRACNALQTVAPGVRAR